MKTADIYTDMGRFNMAAKNHCAIAELFENECPDVAQCMAHYQVFLAVVIIGCGSALINISSKFLLMLPMLHCRNVLRYLGAFV